MSVSAATRVGQLLDRKYRIVRLLGEGGMGSVFEARHELIGRRVAIKFLHPDLALHAEMLMRFRREAQAAGALENENIAAVTDFGESEDGAPYIVMEFLVGEDLSKLLQREGALPVSRLLDVMRQACRGLRAAHEQGIVHRDLKPENLFVVRRPDGDELIKLLDFGIAKLQRADSASSTRTGAAMGTPYYMSREQARGQKDLDARADIYALGVIMYELLSGQKPYQGDGYNEILFRILTTTPPPLASLRPELPAEVVALVERALALEPAERFQSVDELLSALNELRQASDSRGPARPSMGPAAAPIVTSRDSLTAPGASTTLPELAPSPRRSKWLGAALSVAALVAAAVSLTWRAPHHELVAAQASAAQPAPTVSALPAAPAERRDLEVAAPATSATAAAALLPVASTGARRSDHRAPPLLPASRQRRIAVDPYAP